MLIKFIFSYMLLFVGLPMLVIKFDKDDTGWADKLFISLIHSTFYFIVVVHLLVLLKLYETLSILTVIGLTMFFLVRYYRKRRPEASENILAVVLFDVAEDLKNWRYYYQTAIDTLRNKVIRSRNVFFSSLRVQWFAYFCIITTLIYAAYTRFRHSLVHLYFGASDPYVHLQFAKFLDENKMFTDGIYPLGFASIISVLDKVFNMDVYIVARFIGPLCGMLIVLSIFYALTKMIGNRYSIIFIGLFVYTAYAGLPTYLWRQISALSMEYAVIFLLPGIALLLEYLRKDKLTYLILAGECLAITLFIHLYTAVALGLAYIVVGLCYSKIVFVQVRFLRLVTVMITSGIFGLLPLIFAFLLLPPEEFTYAEENLQPAGDVNVASWLSVFLSSDIVIQLLVIAAILFVIWRAVRGKTAMPDMAMLLTLILFYFIYESKAYHLPAAIPADRFGVFFSLICSAGIAVVINSAVNIIPYLQKRPSLISLSALLIAGIVLWSGPVNSAPAGSRYQYDSSVQAYLNIKSQFQPLNWTIIGPIEEYHLAYRYGRHTQIWEFAEALSQPKGKTLKFPTDDVFIFIEKIPLGSDQEISDEDVRAPFPEFTGTDLTEFYYRNVENRRIIQAKVNKWVEEQSSSHDIKIYYDSPELRVYWIHQDGKNPHDLLSWGPLVDDDGEG
ncbi:hypothetical protein [Paenibacillus thermotolerans]|uniref:hypothetical protein n=1 Tax=Paenibacillus thermotolerans TaxID=3027807 RepID=UPI0023689319|nr:MULTISPECIES: hypothetical protein [unclassified Paenibacillus]